jgi:hypothetical protein
MRITRVLDTVYDAKVGWNPSTGSIKPVHIANGFFRELTRTVYDTEPIVAFAVPGKKGEPPKPSRTYKALVVERDDPRLAAFAATEMEARFERLREAVRGVLAADKGVFPEARLSSLTLTCPQMISADNMDKRVGAFMAALLRGPDPDAPGPLAKLLLSLMAARPEVAAMPRDPISFLVWPLLSHEPEHLKRESRRCPVFESKSLSSFAAHFAAAAESLAAQEKAHGNRLATLERGVQFVCLAVLAHAQALAANGRIAQRPPLLIAMDAQKGSRLATASETSLLRYYESFEAWLGAQLADRIRRGQVVSTVKDPSHPAEAAPAPESMHRGSVRAWLKTFGDAKGNAPSQEILDDRMAMFEEALAEHGKEQLADVLGATVAGCYYQEYKNGGPRDFLQGIGKQIGLIFPHGAGRSQDKRIRPSVQTLDVLVKACTPTERPIPLDEFLRNLWHRFGLVVHGTLEDDVTVQNVLTAANIDVSPTDLKENRNALVSHLVDVGLARRYPDNVAYVGRFNA